MNEERPDWVFRFMGGQLNSTTTKTVRDKKISDIHQIIDQWNVQGGGFSEIGINWQCLPHTRGFSDWFRSHPDDFLTSTAQNTNENVSSVRQQGKLALFAGKELRQYIKSSSKDFRHLGRWNSWLILANPSHPTRVIVVYQVGASKPKGIMTIYQQHLRHIQTNCLSTNPKQLFQDNLIQALKKWIGHGEHILLLMDMNEHIISGSLAQELQWLDLVEATNEVWQDEEPHTLVFGRSPIDGVYHTIDLEVAGVILLSFHKSMGNHRTILVDITTCSAISQQDHKIVCLSA
jgi:hypothetical protein